MPKTSGFWILALALWLVSGCAGGQPNVQKESAELATGTFVGEIPEADAFVALIAADPEQGENTREVRAYLCDGKQINEWFWDTAEGNDLDLSSEDGSRLAAEPSPEGVSGTITLPDGEDVGFQASPAMGVAGLYDVSFASDGSFGGTSEDGARLLEARLGEEVDPGTRRIGGTITSSEGEPKDFEAFSGREAQPGEYRWIVLSDGRAKGGAKKGSGPGFIDRESDL
jgi:hypothetical protein